jgi:WD40 repeat protein
MFYNGKRSQYCVKQVASLTVNKRVFMRLNLSFLRPTQIKYYLAGVRPRLAWLTGLARHVSMFGFVLLIANGLAIYSGSIPVLASTPQVPARQFTASVGPVEILSPMKTVGHGTLNSLDWSVDGSQLAIASSLGLYLYDPLTLRELDHLDEDHWILQLHFDPKGEKLATIDRNGGVTLWNLHPQPLPISHMDLAVSADRPIRTLAFRDDLGILAVGRGPTTLQLIDLNQGSTIAWINLPDYPDSRQIEALAFSPDGKELALDVGFNVYLIDPSSGAIQRILQGDHDAHHLAFSPARSRLAVDNAIYDLQDGSRKQVFWGFSPANIQAITYSPDGQVLAITTGSKVSLVDIVTGRVLQELVANGVKIRCVKFNPDGRKVAGATDDDRLWVWEVINGEILNTTDAFTGPVLDVDFSSDGNRFAAVTSDHIWLGDAQESSVQETLPSPAGSLTRLAFNPNNLMFATAGDWLRLWNINATILHQELVGHTARVNVLAFSPDGRYLATAGSDYTVRIWNSEAPIWVNGNDFSRASIADLPVNIDFLSFSPDGSRLAGGSRNSPVVYIWDARNGMPLLTLNGPVGGLTGLRFSPDGSLLAVSGVGYRRTNNPVNPFQRSSAAFIWSTISGKPVASLGAPGSSAALFRFNQDGHIILCDCQGNNLVLDLWHLGTSEDSSTNILQTLPPIRPDDPAGVTGAVFSPDGMLLAVALADGQIEIWGTENQKLLYNLSGHRGLVNSMAFRPDGKLLLSGGQDGILIFWSLP